MTDNPLNIGPQDPDPQNPYAQGVPGPQPGYGQPQQPPYGHPAPSPYGQQQQPPYGQQPSGGLLAVGEVVNFAWRSLFANFGPWLILALIVIGFNMVWSWLTGGFQNYSDQLTNSDFAGIGMAYSGTSMVWVAVGSIISYFIGALFVRGALDEADGRRPGVGEFFRLSNISGILVAALLVGLMINVGTALCFLPGIAAAIFSAFTLYFVLDRQQNGIQAIGSSFSLVAQNFGPVFLLMLAFAGINILGALLCGLGLFITIPMSYIGMGYAFRRLAGRAAF